MSKRVKKMLLFPFKLVGAAIVLYIVAGILGANGAEGARDAINIIVVILGFIGVVALPFCLVMATMYHREDEKIKD